MLVDDLRVITIPHEQLSDASIVDDTGAGDVFAGALLAAESAGLDVVSGSVNIAVQLAQTKLRTISQLFGSFAELTRLQFFARSNS